MDEILFLWEQLEIGIGEFLFELLYSVRVRKEKSR